jgi:hypothetical protein
MGSPRRLVANDVHYIPITREPRGLLPTNPRGPGRPSARHVGLECPKVRPVLMDSAHLVCDLHRGQAIADYGATTFTLNSVEAGSPFSGVPFT